MSRRAESLALENVEPMALQRARFVVEGMDCADCARRVEERLNRMGGVRATASNTGARIVTVEYEQGLVVPDQMRAELGRIGYLASERDSADPLDATRSELWRTSFAKRTYVSAGCFGIGLVLLWTSQLDAARLLFLFGALVGGWNFMPVGFRALFRGVLDMHVLMTFAILGAIGLGEPLEAAAIAFLFSLAELLEQFAVRRAHDSLHGLLSLSPERATVLRDGEESIVPADELRPGELILLKIGERVPVDGTVVEGATAVDASAITGESVPVDCAVGDSVMAGMRATGGFAVIRVDRPRDESTLARIVQLIERAQARKARSERFVARFARVYTPAVTAFAFLVVTIPTVFLGAPFDLWFERALTLLVIACPCALVISTPVAVVSGLTAAARHGVLIKGGETLEELAGVRTIALDKTGTLTYGHPVVTDVEAWDDRPAVELMGMAAAAERRSEHPLARAIVRGALERGIDIDRHRVAAFAATPGVGVTALVDGEHISVGGEHIVAGDKTAIVRIEKLRESGKTVLVVSLDGQPAGMIALADRPRAESREAVETLARLGIRPVMLTGDDALTASQVASAVGISEFHARLTPDEKLEWIERVEPNARPTAMVGDGVNDAPALAAAGVGIAMGAAGSDVALETADAALMGDQVERLPYLFRLARASRRVIRQNVIASILIKLSLAAAVPFGFVSLVAAVLVGDLGASLGVTANSMRLAGLRPRVRP
jgi:Cd2+/Zn2+-exporting ATPase